MIDMKTKQQHCIASTRTCLPPCLFESQSVEVCPFSEGPEPSRHFFCRPPTCQEVVASKNRQRLTKNESEKEREQHHETPTLTYVPYTPKNAVVLVTCYSCVFCKLYGVSRGLMGTLRMNRWIALCRSIYPSLSILLQIQFGLPIKKRQRKTDENLVELRFISLHSARVPKRRHIFLCLWKSPVVRPFSMSILIAFIVSPYKKTIYCYHHHYHHHRQHRYPIGRNLRENRRLQCRLFISFDGCSLASQKPRKKKTRV